MFCGPGIANALVNALYIGYARMASSALGPCQGAAWLCVETNQKKVYL